MSTLKKLSPPSPPPTRKWYLDGVSAFACLITALTFGKGATRILGPIAGAVVFLLIGGMSYFFGRSAWRRLLGQRNGR